MDKKQEKTKCNCDYMKFLPRLLVASLLIFIFYMFLSAVWYHFMFGEAWFKTIVNAPAEMVRPSTTTMIFMILGNLAGSFITANIFYVYIKRIAIARADKECQVPLCSIAPVIVLLSGFYFMSSAMNVFFDVYTLSHLFIETGYLFIGLCFSGFIVVNLLKKKLKELK